MKTSDNGINLIKQFEGFSPTVYKDLAGYDTIGYGHKILPDQTYTEITEDDATTLLQSDLEHIEVALSNAGIQLNQNQFDALASFAYNLGLAALWGSTLFHMLQQGDYAGAQGQFTRWCYVGNTPSVGLARRRSQEAQLFGEPV